MIVVPGCSPEACKAQCKLSGLNGYCDPNGHCQCKAMPII